MAFEFEKFFPLREESERNDNPMDEDQDYTEGAAKHPRKTQVVSLECAKMCVAGIVMMEGHILSVGQFWVFLLNGFS